MGEKLTLEEQLEQLSRKCDEALRRAERAEAYGEILKVWAAHAYCYRAQEQRFELENYWAREHDDIMYAHGVNAFYGRDVMTEYYARGNEIMNEGKLRLMSGLYPDEIEDIPENLGVGDLVIRCQTTPYIEVAADCKTAKAVFYTLGFNSENNKNGEPVTMMMVGKEAVDFIKESDGWKIWHYRDAGDLAFPVPSEAVLRELDMGERTVSGAFPAPNRVLRPFAEPGDTFSPKKVAKFAPELPAPYETWSEDISYALPAE